MYDLVNKTRCSLGNILDARAWLVTGGFESTSTSYPIAIR